MPLFIYRGCWFELGFVMHVVKDHVVAGFPKAGVLQ
jgi:hypothetical protein